MLEAIPLRVEVPGEGYHKNLISCQACPVHTDARGYVRAIAAGRFEEAYLIARGPNPFASICGRVCGAPCEAAREEADQGLYLALLGPGGAVSAREVAYLGMEDPGRILAETMAFYESFAFGPVTEEPPDHLAVEAGFLGYLCLKEAYALSRGNGEEAEVAAQAAARFRETHLSTLAWPVRGRGPGVML